MSAEGEPAEAAPPTDTAPANGNGKKEPRRNKDNDIPIEELFDLTQPIPKVDKPNKEEHENIIQEMGSVIDGIRDERAEVQKKIDAAMADPSSKAATSEARSKLDALRTKKGALIKEKQAMKSTLDEKKNQSTKLVKDKNDVRSSIKFDSAEKIDTEIKSLRRKQETTSMSLNEEKKLIREIEALQNSKKHIVTLQSKNSALDDVQAQRKTIQEQMKIKNKEIDAVQAEMDTVSGFLKEHKDKNDQKRSAIEGLFSEREEISKRMKEKIKERDAKRTEFREANDKWYTFKRAIYAQKKMKEEEERKQREEEKAVYMAKLAEEEAKKIPYEEEQYLCDYLANFLESKYLKSSGKSEETGSEQKADYVAVSDDPFKGMKARNKKDEEGEEFFGKKKAKKKRDRQGKKQNTVATFSMSYDLIEQFSLVQLSHPNSVEEVEKSVKELREKKEWFKQQPRGSVPTAADIRKAKEAENAKTRKTPSAPKPGSFSLSNDDFVPLSANTGSAVISPWGSKAPEEETAAAPSEEG